MLNELFREQKTLIRFVFVQKNEYNGKKMNECLAFLFYTLPISRKSRAIELKPSEELYKGTYVEYIFDFSKHPEWKGKVTALYYGIYGDVKGEIRIKSLELVDGIPEESESSGSGNTEAPGKTEDSGNSGNSGNSGSSGVSFTMPPEPVDMSNIGGRSIDKNLTVILN